MQPCAPAILLGLLAASTVADALPVLRLAITGETLGVAAGGADPFASARLEALTLERPALLAGLDGARIWSRFDGETTLAITGDHRWAGTRGSDTRALATYVHPLARVPVTLAIQGELADGDLRVRNRKDGVILDLSDRRRAGVVAAAYEPWPFLRAGAALDLAISKWVAEVVARAGPVSFGVRAGGERLHWDLNAPPGPQRRFQRPALAYDVDETRGSARLTLSLSTRLAELAAAWDALQPDDVRVEGAIRAFPWLTLRSRYEATRWAFDDWARQDGVPVARIDLGVHHTRASAGADARLGRHELFVRRVASSLATASAWEDNGEVTAERFFSISAELALYLRHLYRAKFSQWSIGWRRTGERWTFAAGAQHFAFDGAEGGLVYGSRETDVLSGSDPLQPSTLSALGLTAGVGYDTGIVTVRVAAAQLVPYDAREEPVESVAPAPRQPPRPSRPPPSTRARVEEAARTFDGGRLTVIELERRF